jgi:AcrR family transcriptional regulator
MATAMSGKSTTVPANGAALVGRVGRGRIGELQRARILAAMVELVRERGVGDVTVAHVVSRSGVSRRTFYELFEDREACFLAAVDDALTRAGQRVGPAYATAAGDWRQRMRAALAALLEFIDDDPALGALCVVDALAGGPRALARRSATVTPLVDAVHEGRKAPDAERWTAQVSSGQRPARLVAEGVVGAVLAVLHDRLLESEPKPLLKLLSPLMAMIVLPYLGPAAAQHELALKAPRTRRLARRDGPADPLRDLDMRLTHRTVCVLLAIAHRPAASSRQIADAAGVSDQGQISKLLWRLEHLGLIANNVRRRGRGEPNAWSLTPKGREVELAIRAQTAG